MAKKKTRPDLIIWDCPRDCTHGPYGTRSTETPTCDECGTPLVRRPEGLHGTALSTYNYQLEENYAANHQKALTLYQPYATLIAIGAKPIETRPSRP